MSRFARCLTSSTKLVNFLTRSLFDFPHSHPGRFRFLPAPVRSFSDDSTADATTELFQLSNGDTIAYKKTEGSKQPGVIYMSGFLASMDGEKARILERYCKMYDHSFVRFDYRGSGDSTGDLSKLTPEDWLSDALTVLDTLTKPGEPQILVGSSMGAFMMLHVALRRPERIQGLVGIALPLHEIASVGENMSEQDQVKLDEGGAVKVPRRGDFEFKRHFVESMKELTVSLLGKKSLPIHCPVRLVHGMKDDEVPWEASMKVVPLLETDDVQVILSRSASHRFSNPQDLQVLVNQVDQLLKQCAYPS